jgi:Rrf2 family iron-sulfur cluster assembly transcriptional regulator
MLTTKSRYAVMAMAEMAAHYPKAIVSLETLSNNQDIALNYLEQIFAKLRQGGLVKSLKGPGGGYLLAKQAEEIAIAEIVKAVDESLKMTRCDGQSNHGCMGNKARCITHDLWEGLGEQINQYLSSISLADLVKTKNE